MNGHELLSEPRVMLLAANVAAASLIVGLAALVLRRCLHKRSLPLQHGVLAAAVAVLLLAPALFAVAPVIPGVGINVDEWIHVEDQLAGGASSTSITSTGITPDNIATNSTGESRDEWLDDPPPIAQLPMMPLPVNDGVFVEPADMAMNSEWELIAEGADKTETQPDTDEAAARMPVQDLASMPVSAPFEPPVTVEIAAEESYTSAPGFPVQTLEAVASALLLVWLGGVAIGLLRCVCGYLLVARLRRRAAIVDSARVRSLVESVCSDVGLRRVPEILQTDAVDVPLTLGLLRPAIVLPADLVETSSETRLREILLHEAAHVVRRDLWTGAVQRLAGSLYWWNPLVHRVNRLLNDVRESLCDNHVLLAGGDGRDYADTLLTLAARIARPTRTASALGLVGRPSPGLSGRVTHLLERDRDMSVRLSAVAKRVLIVTACATMCGLSVLAVRGPERAKAADDGGVVEAAASEAAQTSGGQDEATATEEPPAQSGAVAPQDPIASSGVVPLLLVSPNPIQTGFQSDRNEESAEEKPFVDDRPKSVEWKSFISVRALFRRMDSIYWLVEQTGAPLSSVLRDFRLLDFELQRQTRARADDEWSNWEEVDIQTAVDVLAKCAGYAPDVVPTGATSASITMPLPTRALGSWDYREVSHPGLQDRQLSADEVARQNVVLRELMKGVFDRRKSLPAPPGTESGGFSNVVFDTRGLVNELGEDVDLNLDFDEILFRYLDFDVSVGKEYRYRVRVKFGTDAQNVLWTDWSDPTGIVSASGLPGTESSIAARDPRRRGDFRKLLNRSIVRIEAVVDGEARSGSGVAVSAGDVARESGMQSVLTSAHVVKGFEAGRDSLRAQFFGEQDPQPQAPDYVSVEEDSGLAVVCFGNLDQELPTARLGSLQRLPAVDDEVTYHWWKEGPSAQFSERRVVAVNRYGGPSNLECDGLAESSGGGLFNGRGELVGICVAVDADEQRTVFTSLPAILEFVGVDDEAAAEAPAAQFGSEGSSSGTPVTGTPIGLPGPPHIPVGGPGPEVLDSGVAPATDSGAAQSDVILIALDADGDGGLADVHFLTRSLGSGDDALEQLSRRLAAAAEEAAAAQRKLQVQLSVDPGLKYASVVRVMEICREHDVADVRLSPQGGGDGFVINIGFVRNTDGKKLSETPVVFWDDSAHSPQDLAAILAGERRRRPGADVTVIVRADADVSTTVIQDVIRQAQDAGFDRFALRVLHSATSRPPVQGVILEVDKNSQLVTISVGNDDGIRPQDRLYVSRGTESGAEIIGRITVTRVEADRSVARVTQSQKSIAVGDHVMEIPAPQTGDAEGLGYHRLRTNVLNNILNLERMWKVLNQRERARQIWDDTIALIVRSGLNAEQTDALQAAIWNARPELNGTVLDYDGDERAAQISLGHKDGLRRLDRLEVYRGDSREYVGRILVDSLEADHAVAYIVAGGPFTAGDHVTGPIRPDAPYPMSRVISDAEQFAGTTVQLHFQQPAGMQIEWTDPSVPQHSSVFTAPCRLRVIPGGLTLELTEIPGKAGLELNASLHLAAPNDVSRSYLEHNAIPIELTDEDFSQAEANNFVVKVVYLPDPEFQELAVAGVETLVSTRLNPGVDPVAEADRRGTILAVIRLGNRTGLSSGGPQTDSSTVTAQETFGTLFTGAPEREVQASNPSRIVNDADEYDGPVVQVQFQQPRGMSLHVPGPGPDTTDVVQTPCRLNVTPGTLALKLTDVPGKAGLELYATVEIREPDGVTAPYVEHNAVAIRFTEEDFSQAEANNFVVKVVYLPDPEFQELAVAGVETLVSTRVDPGVDPVAEADRKGTILAVVRLGNRSVGEPGEE